MAKRLILVLTLAFVLGITLSAYAETQNIKVSGDLLMQGISRRNFSLTEEYGGANTKYKVAGLTATARLRIDADLTDNVSVVLRLLNERSWGEQYFNDEGSESDIAIDLAYVTLKEFLYSPMTLTVGRQELHFGNELIIGDADTNWLAAKSTIPFDLSLNKAFDAIRVTLNYDPLIVDTFFSKVQENEEYWWVPSWQQEDRDVDLYGFNALYDLTALGVKGTLEGYYFGRFSKGEYLIEQMDVLENRDSVNTIGVLAKAQITDDLKASIEGAYQFGRKTYDPVTGDDVSLSRSAFAAQLMLDYALPFEDIRKYSPQVGFIYTFLSGDADDATNPGGNKKRYNAWDPMFENQTPLSIVNALFPNTQTQSWIVNASIKPWEDVTLSGAYGYIRLTAKAPILAGIRYVPSPYGPVNNAYRMTDRKDLGHAFDLGATYDYTEDVQFGVCYGFFNPGSAFDKTEGRAQVRNASQMIGSMKVTF